MRHLREGRLKDDMLCPLALITSTVATLGGQALLTQVRCSGPVLLKRRPQSIAGKVQLAHFPPPLAKVFEECATAASKGRSQAQSVTLLVVDCDPISLTSLSHGSRCHVVDLHADPYGWNSR